MRSPSRLRDNRYAQGTGERTRVPPDLDELCETADGPAENKEGSALFREWPRAAIESLTPRMAESQRARYLSGRLPALVPSSVIPYLNKRAR